jgi:predicted NBD/HSP70 family sugar kinase
VNAEARLACIEVGGSSVQTVRFAPDGTASFTSGISVREGDLVALAVPGIVAGGRVVAASNLGWYGVDPTEKLGLPTQPSALLNDGEAQALGEAELRDASELTFLGVGTGIAGAVVEAGRVSGENLFGHLAGYSNRVCKCGAIGCLETVAAGWALPREVSADQIDVIGAALASAVSREAPGVRGPVVVAGGLSRRYERLVDAVAQCLPGRSVERSAAPAEAKSAAAWGLRRAVAMLRGVEL